MSVGRSWFPAARIGGRASKVCAFTGAVAAAAFMAAMIAGCGGSHHGITPVLTSAIVVANAGPGAVNGVGSSVTSYNAGTPTNGGPTTNLNGSSTAISNPGGVVRDAKGHTIVASGKINSILEFAPGANGNTSPSGSITGNLTGLNDPSGVNLDPTGNIIVANVGTPGATPFGSVELFAPINPATPGAPNTKPIATIEATAPTDVIFGPTDAVELALNGTVWAANFFANGIFAYAPFSTAAMGVVPAVPVAAVAGPLTLLNKPDFLVFRIVESGATFEVLLYVTNSGDNTVTVYDIADINGTNKGDIAPRAILSGNKTLLSSPAGIAFDSAGNLWVANSLGNGNIGAIDEYAPLTLSATAGTTATNNTAPIFQLSGSNTQLSIPVGLFVVLPPPPTT